MRPSPVSQKSTTEKEVLVEGVVFSINKSQKNVNTFGLGMVLVSFSQMIIAFRDGIR